MAAYLEKVREFYQHRRSEANPEPIRAEFIPPDKLIEQARILALEQEIKPGVRPNPEFLKEIHGIGEFLHQTHRSINDALSNHESIPPAEEWFVDNFHVIEEQLERIQEDLPKRYYKELPALATGLLKGYPRIYELAIQLIAHSDSLLDPNTIREYIRSYQTASPLTTGELWAISILLRWGLIENMKRLVLLSDRERGARKDADAFAEKLIAAQNNEEIQQILAERSKDPRAINGAFAVQLILHLRGTPPAQFSAVIWLYEQLSKAGLDADDLIRRKEASLAAASVSVSHVIQSLRLLATMDWSELVEDVSLVDLELRKDPSGFYASCDFATRDRYRHVIEDISKRCRNSEHRVATLAVELATKGQQENSDDIRKTHVGYYLLAGGRLQLEKMSGFRAGSFLRWKRRLGSHPFLFYQLPIFVLTVGLTFLICSWALGAERNIRSVLLSSLLFLFPGSALAVLFINWFITTFVKPKTLPKLEFQHGIPHESRTFVVLPCLLTDRVEVSILLSRLEVTYLANNDDSLDFALLTDFVDSNSEHLADDDILLSQAREGIHELNEKYSRSEGPRFHVYHRIRRWNSSEEKWMGWERKRGKLEEFNRLLLGSRETSYLPEDVPQNIKYVITLDADTILPRDSAQKLVGTIAHPLNAPVLNHDKTLVIQGYGILQPRVSHTLISSNHTWFARIFSGHTGLDPYTTAVSDIYQDLFREASYVGKGIYDLAAFAAATDGRFPENHLLSHDLIEGAFARTGLVSDIEFFDDHPSDYTSFILRLHRWVRGDWQTAPWILNSVPGPDGKPTVNTMSWLNRWKLFDNLRRSLVSPAILLVLLLAWTLLPGSVLLWTLSAVSVLLAPLFIELISSMIAPTEEGQWFGKIWGFIYDAGFNLMQSLLRLSFLPIEAWLMSDGIIRTIFRMVRRKRMLEWTTAAQAERFRGSRIHQYILQMRAALYLTAFALILILLFRASSLKVAAPLLLLWSLSPFVAWFTGKPIVRKARKISEQMARRFRSYARDIWRYFETLVSEETHWLPPDNFQETPEPMVAARTSPTNIGFLLLANIAAYDLGYIGASEFVDRTEQTLGTLSKLKTFNGHFFNWYSTTTLEPLEPRYISTVDSGNLVAALITLKEFARRFGTVISKSFEPRTSRYEGVRDTIGKFLDLVENSSPAHDARNQKFEKIELLLSQKPSNAARHEELLMELNHAINAAFPTAPDDENVASWLNATRKVIATNLADYERPQDIPGRLLGISQDAEYIANEIDFRFLFNESREMFAIGFNASNGQLDRSSYDLFASEARLTSFIAIAKGDVPQSNWFRMSRPMTSHGRHRVLVSWSGSMFEYLMPLLFLPDEPKTLLDIAYRGAVDLQKLYGLEKHVPWGISEAAYNAQDTSYNYQYGPFGVPSLGLKRGLDRDLVIAPYATFLASMVEPEAAFHNLSRLKSLGAYGRYGFYESIDYSKDRVPKGRDFEIVQTFMTHHLGMSLVALDNLLLQDIIQKRFQMDPAIQATLLLLQEKPPLAVRSGPAHVVDERPEIKRTPDPAVAREFRHPYVSPPRAQLLSNGSYLVMVSTGGGGYSELQGIRLNRWREDVTLDRWGCFLYIKDVDRDRFWSAGFLPTLKRPNEYKVVFSEDRVEISRRDDFLESHMEVLVSPEDNVEIRSLTIMNLSDQVCEIEVTSYLEVVLNTGDADLAHPAFGNLFVETEYIPELNMLLASRRARGPDEVDKWGGHMMLTEDVRGENHEYETDRLRFIGRNRTTVNPLVLDSSEKLSCTTGSVLDPIFSARCKIHLEPYKRQLVTAISMIADTRDEVTRLGEKYSDGRVVQRARELSAVRANIRLDQLSITRDEADLYQRIAGRLIYSDPSLRPRPAVLARNKQPQSALWPYGISGDLPICLVRVEDTTKLEMVRQLLKAHDYWRAKGLSVDLVILNEYPSSYFQELQEELLAVIRTSSSHQRMDVSGGVFLRRADLMPEEDQILLRTAARVQIVAQNGSLARHVARAESKEPLPSRHVPLSQFPIIDPPLTVPVPEVQFDNGYGGFTKDGKEYVIHLKEGESTPAPWINVISNGVFGFQISETGAGTTWSINSHENRLTPWSNDAVSDPVDCAIYVRDEESGLFWSPTPKPSPAKGNYVIAHGHGYTRLNHGAYGLDQELLTFVPESASVRISRFRLRNPSRRSRRLSVTFYADLVLGFDRSKTAHFISTSIDSVTGALLASNCFNNEFSGRQTFVWMNDRRRTVSGDRTTFLGPNGDLARPAGMSYAHLSGRVGAGLDPCAAVQAQIDLPPLSEKTVIFLFGQGKDIQEIRKWINEYGTLDSVKRSHVERHSVLENLLTSIQIDTPDDRFDLMMNRWLLYQTYSCRFLSRSAFYQSSGAYGFRDQLQDSLAFLYSTPETTREHLLLCGSRQFLEGDVQHWWHPPGGRGVRTRSSDDLLWLPFCTSHYVNVTGDHSVLDEMIPYLEAPVLTSEQVESYIQPQTSKVTESLYEHCLKAIHRSMQFGSHGLPLIQSGDWNDGMNRLGIKGKGESVWLAWFQIYVFQEFAKLCESRFDLERADQLKATAKDLTLAVEQHGWDGEWYLRGYDDDGVPFGSAGNQECKIDSIAQTWGILSGAASSKRAVIAMRSLQRLLIDSKNQLALLLTPPFSETSRDPGYIKGYPNGIRENGGHYNHAAAWVAAAFAELKMPEEALEIFHDCNPLNRSLNPADVERYKLEPYAAAGDIYSHPAHLGRGGWSWYTGSSGWLYRVGLEWILGFRLRGDQLTIRPRIPASWPKFQLTFHYGKSTYHIVVENSGKGKDGEAIKLSKLPGKHEIKVEL